ncbi:unnamed protein product [Gongylonema pulchrum]|uniref:Vps4_C domain-containing protein n=1 Tax=Gongylonema pulchrum TaxID=637853 RepID=A0A183DM26_9BILA|nr:unnamed protein product [Gongylonema pulchrum]
MNEYGEIGSDLSDFESAFGDRPLYKAEETSLASLFKELSEER